MSQSFDSIALKEFQSWDHEQFDPYEIPQMQQGTMFGIMPFPELANYDNVYILYDFETCPKTNMQHPVIISIEDFMRDWHYEYRIFLNKERLLELQSLNLKFYKKKKGNALKFMEEDI